LDKILDLRLSAAGIDVDVVARLTDVERYPTNDDAFRNIFTAKQGLL
jgi:hypothetical protein